MFFFSASDADSEGEEGIFFTWRIEELKSLLNENDLKWLQNIYGFTQKGNFEHRNILKLSEPLLQTAKKLKQPYSEVVKRLDNINSILYQHRKQRITPLIDNKIITSWNTQMIYSLAYASSAFNKPQYLQVAITAMDYLLLTHKNQQGHMVRNSLNGKASTIDAELEDYAWMITALVKLYDVTDQNKWLLKAKSLINITKELYIDNTNGGFFDNIIEEDIPNTSRIKKSEDGAMVSANGQLLIALARYYRRTGDLNVDELFTQSLAAFSGKVAKNPVSHTSMLHAKYIYDHGENSNIAYTGNGNVKITTHKKANHIEITFDIKDNWHINSNQNPIESLIPLTIESNQGLAFNYPLAKIKKLDFNENDLSTFDGRFTVTANYTNKTTFPLQLNILLQTCSNKICLAPSKVKMKVY